MLRGALRRILILLAVIFVLTTAISLALGALAHSNLAVAVAHGFYVVGVAILVGCFIVGARGPMRAEWGTETRPLGGLIPRSFRRATSEERVDAKKNSVGLFLLGLFLLLVGAVIDPTKRVF